MIKGQSKLASFWEANVNTFVRFTLTMLFSPLFYWLVGITYNFHQLWEVTLLFTILSIVRGYVIRRWFNKKEEKQDAVLEAKFIDALKLALDWESRWRFDTRNALILIHGYKQELDMCKFQYQAFVADATENGFYDQQQSNKSDLEDANNS